MGTADYQRIGSQYISGCILIKERETEYKVDIENYRKEGHSWQEIFEMLKLRLSVDPVVAECDLISWIIDCREKE